MSIFTNTKRNSEVAKQRIHNELSEHDAKLLNEAGFVEIPDQAEMARLRSKVVLQRRELKRINKALEQRSWLQGKYVEARAKLKEAEAKIEHLQAHYNDSRATADHVLNRLDNAEVVNVGGKRYYLLEA